jgi:MtN3 and saliva related transmembrane protein
MDYVLLGYVAGFFTTFSLLPEIWEVFKTKSAKDLSYGWLVAYFVGFILWTAYGVGISSMPLMFYNVISIALLIVLFALKIKYGKRKQSKQI